MRDRAVLLGPASTKNYKIWKKCAVYVCAECFCEWWGGCHWRKWRPALLLSMTVTSGLGSTTKRSLASARIIITARASLMAARRRSVLLLLHLRRLIMTRADSSMRIKTLKSEERRWRRPHRLALLVAFVMALALCSIPTASSAAIVNNRTPSSSTSTTPLPHHRHHHHHHRLRPAAAAVVCPWKDSSGEHHDVAGTRAYLAPVVFEGKARSKSTDSGPVYRVTFDVVTVYKGGLTDGSQVRLEFINNNGTSTTTTTTTSRRTMTSSKASSSSNRECLVSADIRTGRRYLVFAAHWGPNNLTAVGSPLIHTKKNVKDVRSTLCPRCGKSFLFFFISSLRGCVRLPPSLPVFWHTTSGSRFFLRPTLFRDRTSRSSSKRSDPLFFFFMYIWPTRIV